MELQLQLSVSAIGSIHHIITSSSIIIIRISSRIALERRSCCVFCVVRILVSFASVFRIFNEII